MTHSRRMFLGSAAALAGGAFASLHIPAAAQRRANAGRDPVTQELLRQIRGAMTGLLDGEGEGARRIASTLRVWAAHLQKDEAALAALLREGITSHRRALLSHPGNHAEMTRIAEEIGFPLHRLPPHTVPDPVLRERALNQLLKDGGITPSMRRAADILEELSAEIDKRHATVRTVVRQSGDPCEWTCATADNAEELMEAVCAVASLGMLIPGGQAVSLSACAAATTTWLTAMAACQLCQIGQSIF